MQPQYVARKSKATAFTPLRILCLVLLFWTIIPIVYIVIKMVQASYDIIEFYEDSVIVKTGWIAKSERKSRFDGVTSVAISQSVMGAIFNYGDLEIDTYGKWDISTTGISNPRALKEYLETRVGGGKGGRTPTYVDTM